MPRALSEYASVATKAMMSKTLGSPGSSSALVPNAGCAAVLTAAARRRRSRQTRQQYVRSGFGRLEVPSSASNMVNRARCNGRRTNGASGRRNAVAGV